MTIQPMATPTAAPATGTTASQGSSPDDVNENEFLQLLVAQIQYQDPTNPTDSTTFVTQLAQFSSLEQLIAIRGDLDSQAQSGTSGTQNTTSNQGGN
ncbi:MAG: flagellar hook capping FlgD N-terminal domain-containing protein [Bryobacteraceae bacterium]|jgi:flagellar basal-body rod modification protein FlgD